METLDSPDRAQLIHALLKVVFPNPRPAATVNDPATGLARLATLDPATLNPAQICAVRSLGRNPFWEQVPFVSGDLRGVLLEFHLPFRPESFRELIEALPA